MPSGTQPHPLQLSILLVWRAQDGDWGGGLLEVHKMGLGMKLHGNGDFVLCPQCPE